MLASARIHVSILAAMVALFVGAPAAAASTTIGQTSATPGPCPIPTGPVGVLLQSATAGSPGYSVPAGGGVITSWSTYTGSASGLSEKLVVFRPAGGSNYTVVGASAVQGLTASSPDTFPTRIPVQAGDLLGLSINTPGSYCLIPGAGGDTLAYTLNTTDPAVGSTFTPGSTVANYRLNLSSKVEPDADGDGFGDETQDQCPTNAGTQGACPPPPQLDTTAPSLDLAATGGKLSRRGGISFVVTSNENATGTATGTISLPKASKTVRFKTAKVTLSAGKLTKVTLKLSERSLGAVRKALKRHSLKAKITVTVKDGAGNQSVKKLTLKLKR